MPIDPYSMRIATVHKACMENAILMYLQSGFTEDECVDTVAKQFHPVSMNRMIRTMATKQLDMFAQSWV